MQRKIGFIGCGNMGTAMMGGIIKSGLLDPSDVFISDMNAERLQTVEAKYGVNTSTDNSFVAKNSDIIVMAVKPNIFSMVLEGINDDIDSGKIILSIAAGKTIGDIENVVGSDKKIVRTMPNTPALVGEGMTAVCPNSNVKEDELAQIDQLLQSFGKTQVVAEYLMDAVIGISGSSPAYVFMFIEAMADAAVMAGLPRDSAYKMAAQAVLGSAKMVLETGKHPGELKDMVCSPGGTTIEAVAELEKTGLRASVISGVQKCIEKSIKMSKPTNSGK